MAIETIGLDLTFSSNVEAALTSSIKALEKHQARLDKMPLQVSTKVDDSGVQRLLRLTGKLRQAGGIRIPVALSEIAIGRLKSRINNLSKEVKPFQFKLPDSLTGKDPVGIPARLKLSTAALTAIRKQEPVVIPVHFDTSAAKAQMAELRKEAAGGVVGKGGTGTGGAGTGAGEAGTTAASSAAGGATPPIALGPSTVPVSSASPPSGGAVTRTSRLDESGKLVSFQEVHQLEDGLKSVRQLTKEGALKRSLEVDTRPLVDARRELDGILAAGRQSQGKAKGLGDLESQAKSLREQEGKLRKLFSDRPDIQGTQVDKRREHALSKTAADIAKAEGQLAKQKAREASSRSNDATDQQLGKLRQTDALHARELSARKDTAKITGTLGEQEKRLNALSAERVKLLSQQRDAAAALARRRDGEGETGQAKKARTKEDQATRAIAAEKRDHIKAINALQVKGNEQAHAQSLAQIKAETSAALRGFKEQEAAIGKRARARPLSDAPLIGGPNKKDEKEFRDVQQERANFLEGQRKKVQSLEKSAVLSGASGGALSAQREGLRLTGEQAKAHHALETSVNDSSKALQFHSRSLIKNAVAATAWLAPMQVLFAVIGAVRAGVRGMIEVNKEFGTLTAVYDATAEAQKRLKTQTLSLAVAQGSDPKAALEGAVEIARLQRTELQTVKLLTEAIVAKNVAEISQKDASKFLVSTTQAYNLALSDTEGLLNRVNSISNTWSVSNKDIIAGLQRVSSLAKQSGFGIQNLEGVLGASIAASGRPGAEIGQSLKFIINNIRKSGVQEELRDVFNIDITDGLGSLLSMKDIFEKISLAYQKLTPTQQSYFINLIAGSRQASRLANILDTYTQSQNLVTRAVEDSNSAFRENLKVLATIDNRIQSVKAAWVQLFDSVGGQDVMSNALDDVTDGILQVQQAVGGMRKAWDFVTGDSEGASRVRVFDADLRAELNKLPEVAGEKFEKKIPFPPGLKQVVNFFRTSSVGNSATQEQLEKLLKTVKDPILRQKIKILIDDEDVRGASGDVDDLVRKLNLLEQRAGGFEGGAKAFKALAERARNASLSLSSLTKDAAESAKNFALDSPEGVREIEFKLKVNELIDSGERDKLAQLFETAYKEFTRRQGETGVELTTSKPATIDNLRNRVAPLRAVQLAAVEGFKLAIKKRDELLEGGENRGSKEFKSAAKSVETFKDKVSEAEDELKNVEEGLRDVSSAGEGLEGIIPDGVIGQFEKRFEALRKFREESGKLISGIDLNQADPTGGAILTQAQAAIELQRSIQQQITRSASQSLANKVDPGITKQADAVRLALTLVSRVPLSFGQQSDLFNGEFSKGLEERQRELATLKKGLESNLALGPSRTPPTEGEERYRNQLDATTKKLEDLRIAEDRRSAAAIKSKTELSKFEREVANPGLEKARRDTEAAQARFQREEGARRVSNRNAAFAIGTNDSERLVSQSRQLLRGAPPLELPNGVPEFKPQETETAFSRVGAQLQRNTLLRQNINTLETRQNQIIAERQSSYLTETQAIRRKNEEIAKSLALSDRETQLRAAVLARTTQDNPVSLDEFSFFGQETKQTLSQFNPLAVRDGRGNAPFSDASETGRRAREDLDREALLISGAIGGIRGGLEGLQEALHSAVAELPESSARRLGVENFSNNASVADNPPKFELNVGGVNIDLKEPFLDAVQDLAVGLRQEVRRELDGIRASLNDINERDDDIDNLTSGVRNSQD